MDDTPVVPRLNASAVRDALKEAPSEIELSINSMKEESVGTYIVPLDSTNLAGDAGEAAVIDADVQIANGVLRAVAAGWNNARTLQDVSQLAKLTLDVVERRRKLLNHQHGPAASTKTLNLNDYVS